MRACGFHQRFFLKPGAWTSLPSPHRACAQTVRGLAGGLAGIVLVAALGILPASAGDSPSLRISAAWVAAVGQTGGDIPLALTIVNDAAEADALLRVSCPFVNFAEKHTVDRGEGAPSMRVIRTLPIPASATTELNGDGNHVMLLQVREKLVAGEKLACTVTFQKAGKLETEVEVRGAM